MIYVKVHKIKRLWCAKWRKQSQNAVRPPLWSAGAGQQDLQHEPLFLHSDGDGAAILFGHVADALQAISMIVLVFFRGYWEPLGEAGGVLAVVLKPDEDEAPLGGH